jgi:hypothetical protein
VNRRCWAGKVVDLVDLQHDGLNNVVANQLKVGVVQEVSDVLLAAGEEVVKADDLSTDRTAALDPDRDMTLKPFLSPANSTYIVAL